MVRTRYVTLFIRKLLNEGIQATNIKNKFVVSLKVFYKTLLYIY